MDWERAPEVLEQLRIPIHAIGVGAQAECKRDINLSEASQRVWRQIAGKSVTIGVRGQFTADTLRSIGITNTEIVGCPSLFRRCNRNLKLQFKPPSEIKRVAFSLRRETSKTYAVNQRDFVRRQKEFLLKVASSYDVTVTIHGEPEEKAFHDGDAAAIAWATQRLRDTGWFTDQDESRLGEIYRSRLFLHDAVAQYDSMIRSMDFAIGYRVHGVLPALANGIPAILVTYDTRSEELAQTFSIPTIRDTDLDKVQSLANLLSRDRFEAFERNFQSNYDRMKAYLAATPSPIGCSTAKIQRIQYKFAGAREPHLRSAPCTKRDPDGLLMNQSRATSTMEKRSSYDLGCLPIIARYHSLHLTVAQLMQDGVLSGRDVSFSEFSKCAHISGLKAKAVHLDWHGIAKLQNALPVMITLKNGSSLVLLRVDGGEDAARVVLQDPNAPEDALLVIDRPRLEQSWTGEVVLIKRDYDIRNEEQPFCLGLILALLFRERRILRDTAISALVLGFSR